MKRFILCAALMGVSVLTAAAPALAHHSFAMFDQTKTTAFKGATITKFQWANPHVFVLLQQGNVTYTLECSSPSNMREMGWKFNSLKAGDKVDVEFFPLRDGRPGGALKLMTLPNGQKLKSW